MVGPEGGHRRGIFFRSTPAQERVGVIVPPKPQPVLEPSGEPEPKKTKRSLIQRLLNNLALRWTLAGLGLASAGGIAYQLEVPAVHRTVNNLLGIVSARDVPNTFDNTRDEGLIGENNINHGNLSEVQSQFPEQIIEKGNTISLILPFILPEGTTASYIKSLSDRLPTEELQKQAQAENDKNNIDFVLPKGTVIVSPVNGNGAIGFGTSESGQDATKAYGAAIVFHDKSANKTYLIKIFSLDQTPFEPIINIPRFDDKQYFRDTGWKDLPMIDRATPLIQTQNDNQQVRVSVEAYEGERIGPEATITDKALYLLTPQFFTTKDSLGQDHVFMLLQKN